MKLKFDASLDYQIEAIKSVTDLFEGMPAEDIGLRLDPGILPGGIYNDLGVGNSLMLPQSEILENLHKVQARNNVPKSRMLVEENTPYDFPNFSVEMETGTGKTYVYLRTIFELNKRYGFRKFIIVVPSVAIREGVTSSIRLMREHFRTLYDNTPFDHFVYRSKDLSRVRQFAVNNEVQIMIINIQAFQKDAGEEYDALGEIQKKTAERHPSGTGQNVRSPPDRVCAGDQPGADHR